MFIIGLVLALVLTLPWPGQAQAPLSSAQGPPTQYTLQRLGRAGAGVSLGHGSADGSVVANGLDASGRVVGCIQHGSLHVAAILAPVVQELGTLTPGMDSCAEAVDGDSVAVASYDANGNNHAAVWTPNGGLVDINGSMALSVPLAVKTSPNHVFVAGFCVQSLGAQPCL